MPPTCRGVGAVAPQPAAWRGARLTLGHNTTTPSPNCAARAPRAVGPKFRSPYNRAVAVLVQSSLSWRLGEERTSRWPQHNHARSALRGACTVDGHPILSTRRRVHGPGTTRARRGVYEVSKPLLPTSCGVGAVEPQPMAWGRAHLALAHNTTTPSAHCAERAPWR